MVIFRHDTGPAVYNASTSFDPASRTTPSKTIILALARLQAWIAFVVDLLREKESGGGRRQKNYSDNFGEFLCLATTQLVGAVRQFVEYWHSRESNVDTERDSVDLRKIHPQDVLQRYLYLASPFPL